MNSLFLEC